MTQICPGNNLTRYRDAGNKEKIVDKQELVCDISIPNLLIYLFFFF